MHAFRLCALGLLVALSLCCLAPMRASHAAAPPSTSTAAPTVGKSGADQKALTEVAKEPEKVLKQVDPQGNRHMLALVLGMLAVMVLLVFGSIATCKYLGRRASQRISASDEGKSEWRRRNGVKYSWEYRQAMQAPLRDPKQKK